MKKRIQYMFEMGDTSYIEILLSKGSIADNLNRAEFVSELVKYEKGRKDEVGRTFRYLSAGGKNAFSSGSGFRPVYYF